MKLLSIIIVLLPVFVSAQNLSSGQLQVLSNIDVRESMITGNSNKIYLDGSTASLSSVTIHQAGNKNRVGDSLPNSTVGGSANTVSIKQGSVSGTSLADFTVSGGGNTIDLQQSFGQWTHLPNSSDVGNHYSSMNITGNSNLVIVKQSDDTGLPAKQRSIITVSGNQNIMQLNQHGSGDKTFFGNVGGSQNIIDLYQQDSGSHTLDVTSTGNLNVISVIQRDSGSHRASITVNNALGPSTISVLQQGATSGLINIQQNCANLSGCSVSVIQGQ